MTHHTTSGKDDKCCDQCDVSINTFDPDEKERTCRDRNCECHKDGMEERFDKLFHYKGNGHWFHTINVCADEDDVDKVTGTTDTAWAVPESFKDFFRSESALAVKEAVDIIKGRRAFAENLNTIMHTPSMDGAIAMCDDILSRIHF